MVKPYIKHEQLKKTIFVQDHSLAAFIGVVYFDKVLKKKKDGSYEPHYSNLPAAR